MFTSLLIAFGFAQIIQNASLIATQPNCSHPNEPTTFCARVDVPRVMEESGLEAAILGQLAGISDPKQAVIHLGFYSFTQERIFNRLCELGKQGAKIQTFIDNDDLTKNRATLAVRLGTECGPSAKTYFLGAVGRSTWRLHHNKFLMIQLTNEPVGLLSFASGNLSNQGVSIHFDHWMMMHVLTDSQLWQDHECMLQGLLNAQQGELPDRPSNFEKTLANCRAQKGISSELMGRLEMEGIASIFGPNSQDEIFKSLQSAIDAVQPTGRISAAVQHFRHEGLVAALARAKTRGVNVQLILDDDSVTGVGAIPGTKAFFEKVLLPTQITIRVMRTNNKDFQMMHNKFLIFDFEGDGSVDRAFAGAGHFTTAAFKLNYENFYWMTAPILTQQYHDFFDSLWARTQPVQPVN